MSGERSIGVYTRHGRLIENVIYRELPEAMRTFLDDAMMRQIDTFGSETRRRIQRRRSSSVQYNCHGLTFANRRTNIEPDAEVMRVLEDDGYVEIDAGQVMPGDIVVYTGRHGIYHTGVVVSIVPGTLLPDVDVLSKWGKYGEYLHPVRAYPGDWDRVTYYREGQR